MDAATIGLITTLIQLAIKYVPEMVEQGMLAISLLQKTDPLTEEEKAKIDEAYATAYNLLQSKCDEQLAKAEEQGITE
jgi:hypothetical protein